MNTKLLTASLSLVLSTVVALAELRAGIAVRTVNPDPLLPVSGGVGPSHPVTQRQGDLTVRALVLQEGDTRVAIVSADFLGFPAAAGQPRPRRGEGDPGAEHPDRRNPHPQRAGLLRLSRWHRRHRRGTTSTWQWSARGWLRRSTKPSANLQPVRLKIATGEAKGKIAYNYYAEQLYDPRCHVIQGLDASGKPLVTLVNYAIHPEVLGSDAGICSPDLVGPLYDRLAEKGGGTGIFMNSAQGGMVTADNRLPDGKEARELGRVPAHRPPAGRRSAAHRRRCARTGFAQALSAPRAP